MTNVRTTVLGLALTSTVVVTSSAALADEGTGAGKKVPLGVGGLIHAEQAQANADEFRARVDGVASAIAVHEELKDAAAAAQATKDAKTEVALAGWDAAHGNAAGAKKALAAAAADDYAAKRDAAAARAQARIARRDATEARVADREASKLRRAVAKELGFELRHVSFHLPHHGR